MRRCWHLPRNRSPDRDVHSVAVAESVTVADTLAVANPIAVSHTVADPFTDAEPYPVTNPDRAYADADGAADAVARPWRLNANTDEDAAGNTDAEPDAFATATDEAGDYADRRDAFAAADADAAAVAPPGVFI